MKDVEDIIRLKQAGVERMRSRQRIVHAKIASQIEARPDIISLAIKRVETKLANRGSASCEIYREWLTILNEWPQGTIVAMFRSEDPKFDQLKACAPFCIDSEARLS